MYFICYHSADKISGGLMRKSKMSLAKKMVIALVLGIAVGIGAIFLRVNLMENGNEAT